MEVASASLETVVLAASQASELRVQPGGGGLPFDHGRVNGGVTARATLILPISFEPDPDSNASLFLTLLFGNHTPSA